MDLSCASDAELVARIAAGDATARAAEQQLCQRYAPRARLYGLKHLRDCARAEDLMQLVLMRLLGAARAGEIQDVAHVDRFVLGTCRFTAQRLRSRAQREQPVDAALPELAVEPFALLDTAALLRCLQALEARARRVVMLSFHEERSADEVAAELALSAGNVRVLRHRALGALRSCMERGGSASAEVAP